MEIIRGTGPLPPYAKIGRDARPPKGDAPEVENEPPPMLGKPQGSAGPSTGWGATGSRRPPAMWPTLGTQSAGDGVGPNVERDGNAWRAELQATVTNELWTLHVPNLADRLSWSILSDAAAEGLDAAPRPRPLVFTTGDFTDIVAQPADGVAPPRDGLAPPPDIMRSTNGPGQTQRGTGYGTGNGTTGGRPSYVPPPPPGGPPGGS